MPSASTGISAPTPPSQRIAPLSRKLSAYCLAQPAGERDLAPPSGPSAGLADTDMNLAADRVDEGLGDRCTFDGSDWNSTGPRYVAPLPVVMVHLRNALTAAASAVLGWCLLTIAYS